MPFSEDKAAPDTNGAGFTGFFQSLSLRVDQVFKRTAPVPAVATASSASQLYVMRNANGSETTVNEGGLMTKFRDSRGRQWSFIYRDRDVIQFTDPQERTWTLQGSTWVGPCAGDTPRRVQIDQSHGIIMIERGEGKMVWRPDGTTSMEVDRMIGGRAVKVRYTEFATRPAPAFIVTETSASGGQAQETVTWIRDANGKLFRFEYEGTELVSYVDVTGAPKVIWRAASGHERQRSWQAYDECGARLDKVMMPSLQGVDSAGNRHFAGEGCVTFIVRPSGAAFFPRPAVTDDKLARAPEEVMPRYFNSFML